VFTQTYKQTHSVKGRKQKQNCWSTSVHCHSIYQLTIDKRPNIEKCFSTLYTLWPFTIYAGSIFLSIDRCSVPNIPWISLIPIYLIIWTFWSVGKIGKCITDFDSLMFVYFITLIVLGNWPSQITSLAPPPSIYTNRIPTSYISRLIDIWSACRPICIYMNYVINDTLVCRYACVFVLCMWVSIRWYFDMITHYKYFIMWTSPYFMRAERGIPKFKYL
jgi:hypothetical protein